MNGEELAPVGARPRGSCTKQCHAITCNDYQRHGCHDGACRSTYGLECCPRCGSQLESLVTRLNYEVWCLNGSCDFHEGA